MIRPCWVSGWARQLGVVWLVEASKDLHALQPSSTHQSVLSRQQQQQQQQQASKDLHALSTNHQSVLSRLPSTNLLLLLLSLSCCLFCYRWQCRTSFLGTTIIHQKGLFPPSLRIRNWTCRTSCKGRPGPHAVAVKALRTSSANQLHYALPCEKLRGILCSCPFNTDRILALKNKQKGAQLIGGFG